MTNPAVRLTRRLATALAVAALAGAAFAQQAEVALPDDVVLGQANAPVTIVEYASVGCPHCATFHVEVWPQLKARYIDTGKVRFVYREMLTGAPALAFGGFITARCVPKARYLDVVETIAHNYDALNQSIDLKGDMKALAGRMGVSAAQFEACYKSDAKAVMVARSRSNGQHGRVTGTPTFVINGRRMAGPETLEAFDAAIAAAGG
jgi:protein-disulfide isomerase